MLRTRTLLGLAGCMLSIALPAFSQDENPGRNEVSAQAFGSFLKTTTDNGVDQKATNSGGVLGTYRFFFNRYHGVEADYGDSLNTQSYASGSASIGVPSYSHEVSAAYVFRYPMKRWTPFVLAGVGGLVFDPKDTPNVSSQARAAFVYGGGADFAFSNHIFFRGEYRGLVYNSPTYDLPALAGLDRVTHRAEPSVGFGYRF
jgi:opacity protein-like surface antigen